MNLGISTAWKSEQMDDGHQLLDLIASTGLSCLEIDYRITAEMLQSMRKRLHSSEFTVLTVHNYCPLPSGFDKAASAGILNLASLDEDERRLAVKYSKKTLQLAADLEARLVVFHLGTTDLSYDQEALFAFYYQHQLQSEACKRWQEEIFQRRAQRADKFLQQLLRSLDAIHKEAYRLGVLIGAENRYRISQLPFGEEFEILFKEFAGGQVRYWHDVGHAEIYHRLGIFDHQRDYLQRWAPYLAGFHLHDVKGLNDHLAPGSGDVDFHMLKPFLKADTIRILEVHGQASVEDIRQAVELLQGKGLL